MAIDQRIRDLRSHFGLTQAEFGARVGVSAQAVNQWETPERDGQSRKPARPSKAKLAALTSEFGARLSWLMSNDGPMFENNPVQPGSPPLPSSARSIANYVGFDPAAFGRRLELIVGAGFSDLRERINMDPVRWQIYLNGRGTPDPAVYSAIVDATGLADSFVKFGVPDAMVQMLIDRQAARSK